MRLNIRHTAIASIVSALLVGAGAGPHAQSLRAVDVEAEEQQTETLITQAIEAERVRFAPDAPPLASDPALARMAHVRSQSMANGAPFSHEDD
jgi:uncharacterized protein YkwD